jgi:DNA modification methylase
MPSGKLTIDYLPVASLRLDSKNARLHSDKQVRQIARSIEVFGFNVPILVDADLRVMAGHGRLLAARLLRIADVPAIRLEHLSENQRRAFMLADNRLTENSEWDRRLLAEQLMTLSQAELDFSVEVTGFEVDEIDVMIENLAPAGRCKNDPADAIPKRRTKLHVSQVGDLWTLDRHRVYCGDARSENSYSALMKDCRAQMVFTNPRYNDPVDGYMTGPRKVHQLQSAPPSGEMTSSEFLTFFTTVFAQMVRNALDGAMHFICMDWRRSEELILAGRSIYSEFKDVCVWVKAGAGGGSLYRSQHELIFVFKSGNEEQRNNVPLGKHRRHRTNVWHYPSVNALPSEPASSAINRPTFKPVELVADAILDCSARGSVVLDPFLGSGTTVIAAERTGRLCFGMERDPALVDTAVRRWQSVTGHAAVHGVTGETFAQREREAADGCK